MNENENSLKSYEILGLNIKLKPDDNDSNVSPDKVVEIIRTKSNEILKKAPSLNKTEVILLVALELAKDNLALENNFKNSIEFAQATTKDILSKIDQASELRIN